AATNERGIRLRAARIPFVRSAVSVLIRFGGDRCCRVWKEAICVDHRRRDGAAPAVGSDVHPREPERRPAHCRHRWPGEQHVVEGAGGRSVPLRLGERLRADDAAARGGAPAGEPGDQPAAPGAVAGRYLRVTTGSGDGRWGWSPTRRTTRTA